MTQKQEANITNGLKGRNSLDTSDEPGIIYSPRVDKVELRELLVLAAEAHRCSSNPVFEGLEHAELNGTLPLS